MIHPLLRLIATRPQLLAEHAQAYAELVGEEMEKTTQRWKHSVLLHAVALSLAAVAVVLAGVALMLWAVMAPSSLQAPWALVAAPALPALGAIVCLLSARVGTSESFVALKQQLAADLVMLREVGAS